MRSTKIRLAGSKNSHGMCAMRKPKVKQIIQIIIETLLLVLLILACNVFYLLFFEGFSIMQSIRKVGQEFSALVILLPFGFIFAALVVLTSKIFSGRNKP